MPELKPPEATGLGGSPVIGLVIGAVLLGAFSWASLSVRAGRTIAVVPAAESTTGAEVLEMRVELSDKGAIHAVDAKTGTVLADLPTTAVGSVEVWRTMLRASVYQRTLEGKALDAPYRLVRDPQHGVRFEDPTGGFRAEFDQMGEHHGDSVWALLAPHR